MQNIKELYSSFGMIPNYETLLQKILAENSETTCKVHVDTLNAIKDKELEEGQAKYTKKTSLNFCRQQVVKKALKDSEDIMNNGDFEEYDKIEDKIRKALQVGAVTHDVEDICENVMESLGEDSRVPFLTGVVGIDNLLKGGLAKGEMAILLAPTGVGKTTWLTKVANSAYNQGANVLQIFFEDNVRDIRRKHYTIWTGMLPDEQPNHKEDINDFIEDMNNSRENVLKLNKLSPFGVTVADIRNKLRKLESEGLKFDMLVLDYVDCISSEGSLEGEEWKGEGSIMRSLEALTDEFDIALWTATQGNRESIASEIVTTNQIGGSIKKAQIGHVVISVGKTLEQKENNLATITLLKSRIGKDGIVFPNCYFNNELLDINTDTQNTLLGHAEQKAEEKQQRAFESFKEKKRRERRVQKELDEEEMLENKGKIEPPNEDKFDITTEKKEDTRPETSTIVDQMTDKERAKHAAEVYRKSKNK